MAKNLIREEPVEVSEQKKERSTVRKTRRENPFGNAIRSVFDGTILTREKVIKTAPFLFYLTLLAIVYIANTYYAEKTITKTEKINKEIKELRSEYITIKSEFMFKSRPSEISTKLLPYGIKESMNPPRKIVLESDSSKTKKL
jgi:hypothetical protein